MRSKLGSFLHGGNALLLLTVVVLALAILQGAYDWHLHQHANDDLGAQAMITTQIDNAVNNLEVPAPIDAKTGQVYFPDVHLFLPAPSGDYALRQLVYANLGQAGSLSLQVSSRAIINQQENVLDNLQNSHSSSSKALTAILRQVPSLQACARGVQLFNTAQTNSGNLALRFKKQLLNGTTVYGYSESQCSSMQFPALVTYMKLIQSY